MVEKAQAVSQAIRACGMKRKAVADVMGMSQPTLDKKEKNPDEFTIGEFFRLYYEIDDFSAGRLWDYLEEKRDAKISQRDYLSA